MQVIRGFRFKLKITPEQEEMFRQFSGVCRFVYNLAWEQRSVWGRSHKLGFASQCADLTKLRAEVDWMREVYVTCQQQALRDLNRAFQNFFAGRAGFPRPRCRGVDDRFRFLGRELVTRRLNDRWSAVRLPKIGWVQYRDSQPIRGAIKSATISSDALGWHVAFACEDEQEDQTLRSGCVGIDRGVATTLALSTGEMLTMPATLRQVEVKKRKAQRIAARRKRGSARRRKAQARVAHLQAQQARIRRDFHHRAALDIAKRFGVAVMENLNTRAMTVSARGTSTEPGRNVRQKAGLNREILNAGWHQFARILTYKMEERGGRVETVPAPYTSRTCAACGAVDAASRKSQARFACVECGHVDHADINAAKVIERRWSTPLLRMEGLHKQPAEVRTRRSLLASENLRSCDEGDAKARREGYVHHDRPSSEPATTAATTVKAACSIDMDERNRA